MAWNSSSQPVRSRWVWGVGACSRWNSCKIRRFPVRRRGERERLRSLHRESRSITKKPPSLHNDDSHCTGKEGKWQMFFERILFTGVLLFKLGSFPAVRKFEFPGLEHRFFDCCFRASSSFQPVSENGVSKWIGTVVSFLLFWGIENAPAGSKGI